MRASSVKVAALGALFAAGSCSEPSAPPAGVSPADQVLVVVAAGFAASGDTGFAAAAEHGVALHHKPGDTLEVVAAFRDPGTGTCRAFDVHLDVEWLRSGGGVGTSAPYDAPDALCDP